MLAYLSGLGAWTWVILGVALMGLELAVPGGFLLWLGLAALGTGIAAGLLDLPWQGALLVFVALAPTSLVAGRRLLRQGVDGTDRDVPHLNRRGGALVGQVFTLEAAMAGGEGRIRLGDSSWRVVGPDLPERARVRVVRVEGATLVVEAA